MRKYRLHVNLRYIRRYGWYKKFAFGFTVLCFLFYREGEMVYVKQYITPDQVIDNPFIYSTVTQLLSVKLNKLVPFDFGFYSVETFHEYDIDFNREGFIMEGLPVRTPVHRA